MNLEFTGLKTVSKSIIWWKLQKKCMMNDMNLEFIRLKVTSK